MKKHFDKEKVLKWEIGYKTKYINDLFTNYCCLLGAENENATVEDIYKMI